MATRKPSSNGTAAVAEIAVPAVQQTAGALALASPAEMPLVTRPAVNPAMAKELWEEYVALCNAILDENDFTYSVHGREADNKEIRPVMFGTRNAADEQVTKLVAAKYKDVHIRQRKKRSACDKLARFYNFTVPMTSLPQLCETKIFEVGDYVIEARIGEGFSLIIYQAKSDLSIIKASATVAVRAPSGRVEIGEALCSIAERKKGGDGFAHADHDIPTTAFTRAKNRAILRSIGTGEVSAEEVEEAAPNGAIDVSPKQSIAPTPQPPKSTEQVSNVRSEAEPATKPEQDPIAAAERAAIAAESAEPEKPTTKKESPAPSMGNGPATGGVPQAFIPPAGKNDGFEPLPKEAKLTDRIAHAEKFLYGNAAVDTRRENQLIKYGIFLFPEMKADIETVPGRLNIDKWNAEVRNIDPEQRKSRLRCVESFLKMSGRDELRKFLTNSIERLWGTL